jgi:hypothetical protein
MTPNWTLVTGGSPPPVAASPPPPAPVPTPKRKALTDAEKAEAEKKRKTHAADRRKINNAERKAGRGIPLGENPLTSEVEYTDAETEFSKALEAYRRQRNRPFPTNREVLYVLMTLGYRKVAAPGDTDVESFLSRPADEAVG